MVLQAAGSTEVAATKATAETTNAPAPRYSDNFCQVYIQTSGVWRTWDGYASVLNFVSLPAAMNPSQLQCQNALRNHSFANWHGASIRMPKSER